VHRPGRVRRGGRRGVARRRARRDTGQGDRGRDRRGRRYPRPGRQRSERLADGREGREES
jgi:hypothetical protein